MERSRYGKVPWTIVLLILAFSCALAYGVAMLFGNVFNQDDFGRYKRVDIANIQKLQTTASGFVYYDGSTVSSISSSGDVEWSYLVGMEAGFDATDYGVAAWTDKTITLIDSKSGSTTYNGTMENTVLSARIGEQYTAVLVGPESESTIVLLENSGRQINRIELTGVTAVDYGFFANGSLLWVMVCDSNGTVPTCDILTYKPGKEIVGSISDTEQLMYAVMFQQTQVCVAGDTYLKVYDYSGVEDKAKRTLVYGWYLADADTGSNDPLMAFVTDAQYSGGSDIQDVRLIRSNLDRTVRLPYGCRDLIAVGNTLYGFATDGHLVIMNTDEKAARAYSISLQIDEVYGVTRDNVAVVRSGNSVCLINLD